MARSDSARSDRRDTVSFDEGTPSGPLSQPGPCNGNELRKASRRISQLYDGVIATSGLRSTQRSILVQLATLGAPTMGELAQALVLDRSALAHNLKPLERDGYLSIKADRADRRSRRVSLTPAGQDKLEESNALWASAQRRFESAFGTEQAQALRHTLAIISSAEFVRSFERAEAEDSHASSACPETDPHPTHNRN